MTNDVNSTIKDMLKKRLNDGNKGTFGALNIISGSKYYRGAASLSVQAALRSGVGTVRLVSTERVISSVAAKLDECVYLPVNETENGTIEADDALRKLGETKPSQATLVGCGMTDCPETEKLVSALLRNYDGGLVIDADGLNAIKDDPSVLKTTKRIPIITPHVGEMAKLTGKTVDEVKESKLRTAMDFAMEHNCIVVLKDATTVVCSPEERRFILDRKNSGMAKGGSGDVLAGIIASLLAQGYSEYNAAVLGTAIHSKAGELAAEELTEYAMLPSDVVKYISQAIKDAK